MLEPEQLLTAEEVAHLRHELRTPVNQIVGYCELMLEDAEESGDAYRASLLTEALTSVREVMHLIDTALPTAAVNVGGDSIRALYQALHGPQVRIVEAMSGLLKISDQTPNDDFVADVCRVRDAAERLLPGDRPRAEPTGMFSAPAVSAAATDAAEPRSAQRARILVVDDVEENRGVLKRRLEREGHEVVCASRGAEAIRIANDGAVDLVLLDVMMPEMDGYETLERLKAAVQTRDIPVIMISALDDIASVVRCIERGAEDYLPKPFDPVLLRARISALLEKKALRDREKSFLKDVQRVAAAAVLVERAQYEAAALSGIAERPDELGVLARVFNSMAAGIQEREERLRTQVARLREEISGVREDPVEQVEDDHPFKPGQSIASRYTIEKIIGKGGMGMVYLAHDTELDERVALKTLRAELLTSDQSAIERFRNEIKLARRIAHRNIVRTHDFGKDDGIFFVTMEFVEGTTLRSILDRRGKMSASAVVALGRQLSDALGCAHEEGIIHRDVKPQNLLLDTAGTLKVMDFGVARLLERPGNLTQVGMVVGTPTYMAPEQLLDEGVDARSDLYSVGVVLYECLTGRPPYEAKSPISLIAKILHDVAPDPEQIQKDVPHALSSAVMMLLAKDPAVRVQSTTELSALLSNIAP